MSPRFELLTPRGPGGVAVVAVRGPGRIEAVVGMLRDGAGERRLDVETLRRTHVPRIAGLWLDAELVDEVLVLDRPAEEQLELHLHGSPAVLERLAAAVGALAAPVPTDPRAAQLAVWLQEAPGRAQAALCLEQQQFSWDAFRVDLPADREARAAVLAAAARRSEVAAAQWGAMPLVLCGAQNAGKSTLMNRLLASERVLTGDLPGLTRDPVREATVLAGYPYELFDTAGEGAVADGLDAAAQDLARAAREGRHRLLVVPGTRLPDAGDRSLRDGETFVVRSMADLPGVDWPEDFAADVAVACLEPAAAAQVRIAVGEALREWRGLPPAGPVGGFAAVTPAEREALAAELR